MDAVLFDRRRRTAGKHYPLPGSFSLLSSTKVNGRRSDLSVQKPSFSFQMAISLRKFELSDLDDFMVWASDERVARFCRWNAYTRKEDLLKYMEETVFPHPWFRAICLDGRPVGAISVELNSGENECRGELGYVLAAAFWGRGIAPAAVRKAVAEVFRDVAGLERIEALVDSENAASQRVLEKAGFVKEGLLRKYVILKGTTRDVVIYSLLSTDPQTRPN